MKKRRVLHQACAFSVAVMLVGVNAVPVVAADNNSVATSAATNEDTSWQGKAWATFTTDSSKGTFEGGTTYSSAGRLEETDYTIGYFPTVTAKEGYTWTGWEIKCPDGTVVNANNDEFGAYAGNSRSYMLPIAEGHFEVVATYKQDIPDDRQVKVTFNNVDNATLASGYPTSEYGFWGDDSATYSVPEYKVADGYEITGWTVTGETTTTWSKDKTSFGLADVNPHFNSTDGIGYVSVAPVVTKKAEAVKVVNAKVTVAEEKGYFEEYGEKGTHETTNNNLQESNYTLGYLPKVVAKDGYTWTGWKVTNKAGEEVYSNLGTNTSSIAFDPAKADDYTVEATFEEDKAEEKTVEIYFNVDPEKGSFPDYTPSNVVSFKGIAADSDQQLEIPAVEAKEGYKFIGWRVDGAETGAWDADAKTFGVTGLAHFPEGSNIGYATITAQFAKVETTKVVNATVVTDLKKGYFKGYEETEELHNENLQDSNYNLEFLPEVVANDGYTFTGWVVTDSEGTEVYKLDPSAKTIAFPYGVADDYTVTATYEKTEEPAEEVVVNADIVINGDEGSFKGYEGATKLENKNLQESDYKLGFLPTVVANEGYTFKGWKVTNKAGEEVYNLDTATTSIMFPYGVADDYTVTAVLEKNPEEKAVANANVVINPEEGYFEGYEGATVLNNNNLQDDDYFLNFLPTVVANDGYTFKGWKVTNKAGEEIYNLDANTTSIAFPYGVADDYTVVAVFEKDEEPEEVAVANANVVINPEEGYFEGYEGATTLYNNNLQDSEYNLGFLPTVVANDGYTFKGWVVTNKAGEEIYNLDANSTSIAFPYGVADDYTVTAVLEKDEEPEEVAVVNADVVINEEEGYFEGYEGATKLENKNLQEADYCLGFLPTVVANDGYTFTGWEVTNEAGEVIYTLDADATSIMFPYGVADNYTVTAKFEKKETPVNPGEPTDPANPDTPSKDDTKTDDTKTDDKKSDDTKKTEDTKKTTNTKKKSAKKADEKKSDTVQTGDHSNVFVYVATLLIAGAAAVVAFFRRRNA